MKLKRLLLLFVSPLIITAPLSGCISKNNPVVEEDKEDFVGLVFQSRTFTYDGQVHSLEVSNVPSDALVTYTNNDKVEVGSYEVTALVTKDGYNDKTLTATLTIKEDETKEITFDSQTFTFDNKEHSLEVTNLPRNANVSYSNNNKKYIGTYEVTATITSSSFPTKTLTATLTIVPNNSYSEFTGITFEDKTYEYTGSKIYLKAENVPSFASVTYSNNGQVGIGTYKVTCYIEANNYNALVLTATLTITGKQVSNFTFNDVAMIYGKEYTMEITKEKGFPSDAVITYTTSGYGNKNTFKEPGKYQVTARISASGYDDTYKTATLEILPINFININKDNEYKITNDIKYKTLLDELMKGNFTLETHINDEYFYPNGTSKYTYSSITTSYYDNDKILIHYDPNGGEYSSDEYYQFISNHDSYTFDITFDDLIKTSNKYISNKYYKETYVYQNACYPFAALSESDNGGFTDGEMGGYRTQYSTYKVDTTNNEFIVETRLHYYHPEFDHDEISIHIYKNIGSTNVTIPEASKGKIDEISTYERGHFVKDGMEYNCITDFDDNPLYYEVNVTLDERELVYLPKGTYYLLPSIDDMKVSQISYDYYYKYYNVSYEGYTYRAYFDSDGNYQGEYSDLGFVKYYKDLKNVLWHFNGDAEYYDEWNEQ